MDDTFLTTYLEVWGGVRAPQAQGSEHAAHHMEHLPYADTTALCLWWVCAMWCLWCASGRTIGRIAAAAAATGLVAELSELASFQVLRAAPGVGLGDDASAAWTYNQAFLFFIANSVLSALAAGCLTLMVVTAAGGVGTFRSQSQSWPAAGIICALLALGLAVDTIPLMDPDALRSSSVTAPALAVLLNGTTAARAALLVCAVLMLSLFVAACHHYLQDMNELDLVEDASLASEDDSLEAPLLAHGEGRPSPRRCAYLDWCSKAHNRYFMCIQCWIAVCGPAFVLQATPWRMWPVCYDALARTVSQVSLIAATTLCFRDQPEDRGEDAGDEGGGVAAAVCR